ncbi:MAG: 30S ribosomal protein S6 [Gemmataceae bacterium]|nr:30S ribosomal protein S6 [Gemmataceae bacterium]
MPVNTYETLFLLDPTKLAADGDAVRNQVHHILERHGAQIVVAREWNYNQKLAYPIEKQKKGAYHIVYYTMDSAKQVGIEADFKLAEGVILRQMTLKIDPKWHDEIMNVAQNEGGKEFAIRGMRDETTVQTDPAAIGAEPAVGGLVSEAPGRGGPDRDGADKDGGFGGGPRRGGRRPEPAGEKPT